MKIVLTKGKYGNVYVQELEMGDMVAEIYNGTSLTSLKPVVRLTATQAATQTARFKRVSPLMSLPIPGTYGLRAIGSSRQFQYQYVTEEAARILRERADLMARKHKLAQNLFNLDPKIGSILRHADEKQLAELEAKWESIRSYVQAIKDDWIEKNRK